MKILIVYSTKTGTAEECAELLSRNFPRDSIDKCRIFNGNEKIGLDKYDVIIAGGSVRYGKIQKGMTHFLNNNAEKLTEKPLGLYFCCGFSDKEEEYSDTLFPEKLKQHAITTGYFGGEMQPGKSKNLFDKIVVYLVRSYVLTGGDNGTGAEDASLPSILEDNISRFASEIRRSFE